MPRSSSHCTCCACGPAPTCSGGCATELVSTALEGGAGARDALGRLGLAGHDLVVIAGALTGEPTGGGRDDQLLIADRERFADALAVHLSAVRPGAAVALIGDVAYGILPAAPGTLDRVVAIAQDFLGRVGARLPAVIAVGSMAHDIASTAHSRATADRVLRVIRRRTASQLVASMADVQTRVAAAGAARSDRVPRR